MKRWLAHVAYDGTAYSGYQRQINARSVQGEIEKALAKMHKADHWPSTSSGRTDAGVHGLNQPVHFDSPLQIAETRWPFALNALLPRDIHVKSCREVENNFHARYDALGKEYHYRLYTSRQKDVFKNHYITHYPRSVNWERIEEAIPYLLGEHDFTSYSSPKTDVKDKVRTLYEIKVVQQKEEEWKLHVIGSGFLYQMVRILTGSLLRVGIGEWEPKEILRILEAKDRAEAGPTAPPEGLYLAEVFYEKEALQKRLKDVKKIKFNDNRS